MLPSDISTGWVVLATGVVGLFVSGRITKSYWRAYGLHSYRERKASAGLGVVPSWVSLLGLASWACIAGGVVLLVTGGSLP